MSYSRWKVKSPKRIFTSKYIPCTNDLEMFENGNYLKIPFPILTIKHARFTRNEYTFLKKIKIWLNAALTLKIFVTCGFYRGIKLFALLLEKFPSINLSSEIKDFDLPHICLL